MGPPSNPHLVTRRAHQQFWTLNKPATSDWNATLTREKSNKCINIYTQSAHH